MRYRIQVGLNQKSMILLKKKMIVEINNMEKKEKILVKDKILQRGN